MLKFLDKTGLDTFWAKIKSTFQTLGNLVAAWGSTPSDTKYPSEKLVKTALDAKAPNAPSEVTIATGDKPLIADSSDGNKVKRASTSFDTEVPNTFLKRNGTFGKVLCADEEWGGVFRTSMSPGDTYILQQRNCFFGVKPSAVAVEYSTDGGTTWQDYGLTADQKQSLFSQFGGTNVYCGKHTHLLPTYTGSLPGTKDLSNANVANQRLRITICCEALANAGTTSTTDKWLYANIRRIGIYMSTNGASVGPRHCVFTARKKPDFRAGNDTWLNFGDFAISGDSGWNSIPCNNATGGGAITLGDWYDNQYTEFRFEIWSEGLSSTPASSSTGNMRISKIVAFSELCWENSSSNPNLAYYGMPCTVNAASGNAHFSKGITSGVAIPISSGGTGATTVTAAEYNLLSHMGTELPGEMNNNRWFVFAHSAQNETNGRLAGYRKASTVWSWIKGKLASDTGVNISGNAATATTATDFNTSSGTIKTALDAKVDIANASLESQSTTILAQVQTLASNNIHYKRFYTQSDGGSANISDKPTGTTNGGFMLEAYCNRYISSSDWRYVVLCYVQVSKPKIAWIKTGDTSISWQDLDTNTDTKVKATAKTNDNVNYKILATASASPTSGAATEAVYDTDITLNPSTNTITANVSGNAATATTATNYNTSSGNIKTTLDGKSSTSHTHSVSINGSTKTIAASGGTAVDLGTFKVFNYARVFPMQPYNANTNRYILIASKTATYTHNWEESSMFKLVAHDGLVPKELVFRLWLYGYVSSGSVPSDPSNPKLYRLCAENFSDSELNILDVRMFVVEKSSGSITFTIGIFIDRNYMRSRHVSYQLYPLSYETRDRGNTIDNGLSSWTYTVGQDVYSDLHDSFTMAFAVSELPIRMIATTATDFDTTGGTIKSGLDAKVNIASAGVVATSNSHWDIIMQVATIASNGIHYKRWLCNSDGTSAFVDHRPNSDNASFVLEAYAVKWNSYEDCKYKLLYWRAGKQTPYVAELVFYQAGGLFPETITWYDTDAADTKVKATAKTDNVNYKILATASASPTSGNATEAVYDTDITLNPSTNTISANITGDAQSVRGLYITKTIVNDPNAIIFF